MFFNKNKTNIFIEKLEVVSLKYSVALKQYILNIYFEWFKIIVTILFINVYPFFASIQNGPLLIIFMYKFYCFNDYRHNIIFLITL